MHRGKIFAFDLLKKLGSFQLDFLIVTAFSFIVV